MIIDGYFANSAYVSAHARTGHFMCVAKFLRTRRLILKITMVQTILLVARCQPAEEWDS